MPRVWGISAVYFLGMWCFIGSRLFTSHAALMPAHKLGIQLAQFFLACIIYVGLCWILPHWIIAHLVRICVAVSLYVYAYFLIGALEDQNV